jgi:hypothetical protein
VAAFNGYDIINKLDVTSLNEICGGSKQIAVYGWTHCFYQTLKLNIIGREIINNIDCWNSEARKIERVAVYINPKGKEYWKELLTNIVFENCKRSKMHLPIIPIIFCIDIDNNPYITSSKTIFSRNPEDNSRVTNAELRRAYKLCNQTEDEVSAIAKQTFNFTKITMKNGKCHLERNQFFWENEKWNEEWTKRQSTRRVEIKRNKLDWKALFLTKLQNFIPPMNLLVNANKEKIISLIQNGTVSCFDLNEKWVLDQEIVGAALEVAPFNVMPKLPLDLQLRFCIENRSLTAYVEFPVLQYFKKASPQINWDEEY